MTLDELKAQRDALSAAINSGAYQVRHGEKAIMYQTTSQMLAALARLERKIADAEGNPRRVRRRYAFTTGKGL